MTGPVALPQLRAELLRRFQADQDARFAYLDALDRGQDADWTPVHPVDEDNLASRPLVKRVHLPAAQRDLRGVGLLVLRR